MLHSICLRRFLVAGILAPSLAAAQSSVTVDGRIDTSIDRISAGANTSAGYAAAGGNVTRMNDNTSRLGFKGVESLGGGAAAVFGLEFGLNADAGTLTNPNFRHSYVGLRGGWGTLVAGRLDSGAQGSSPAYSQLARNVRWLIHDAGPVALGTRIFNASNRVSNAVAYVTPTASGFNAAFRVNLAGPDAPGTANPSLRNEGDFRQYQAALNYETGPLRAGIAYAYDDKRGDLQTNDFRNKLQAVGSYDFGYLKPYLAYGQDHYRNTATSRGEVDYWLIGAAAPFGPHTVIANYANRDLQTVRSGAIRKFQVGYSYNFSKRTQMYAFFDHDTSNTAASDTVARALGLGVQHRF